MTSFFSSTTALSALALIAACSQQSPADAQAQEPEAPEVQTGEFAIKGLSLGSRADEVQSVIDAYDCPPGVSKQGGLMETSIGAPEIPRAEHEAHYVGGQVLCRDDNLHVIAAGAPGDGGIIGIHRLRSNLGVPLENLELSLIKNYGEPTAILRPPEAWQGTSPTYIWMAEGSDEACLSFGRNNTPADRFIQPKQYTQEWPALNAPNGAAYEHGAAHCGEMLVIETHVMHTGVVSRMSQYLINPARYVDHYTSYGEHWTAWLEGKVSAARDSVEITDF